MLSFPAFPCKLPVLENHICSTCCTVLCISLQGICYLQLCIGSQPFCCLIPTHLHKEVHVVPNPLRRLPHQREGEVFQRYQNAARTCASAAPGMTWEGQGPVGHLPSPYTRGSFDVGVAFITGIHAEPSPVSHLELLLISAKTWDLWVPKHMDFPPCWW